MKQYLLIIIVFITSILNAQNVFEYNLSSNVTFKVYSETEGKFYKISKPKDFRQNTPEAVALSSFFAYSNEIALKLYFDKEKCPLREDSTFEGIKKTKTKDAYIELLHKTNYNFEGNEMAYIMFMAKVNDIPYRFPTVLSLTKKGDKWFLHQRPNQQKLTECLKMFKPCVLSNLISGNSKDSDIQKLIIKTKSKNGDIDFIKLFDELVLIQENKQLSTKLTMTQNLNCELIEFKNEVNSKVIFTSIYKNLSVKSFRKQDANIISLIKKGNDSIVLKSKLEIDYQNKKITLIKYNEIKQNGASTVKSVRLDNNQSEDQPIKDLLFLFEKLKTSIFSDLTPSLNEKSIVNTELYKKTRGVYEVLNISKLYSLFNSNPNLFEKYLD